MALPPITPRDQVQRLLDLGRKTGRYWWLIALFAVVGGGLSLAFAMTRPRSFQSWAVLFYQERIQSQLLSPGREEAAQRNIGERYRELLLARRQLDQIIVDPTLDPFPQEKDPDVKIEKLRLAVRLESHGANVFHVVFNDSDPERAKRVTDKLTKMLQDKDESLRNEQAAATVAFVTDQQESAREELKKREKAYTEFLAKHPEFVQDANSTMTEGASIRSLHTTKPVVTGNTRLVALERQHARIQASLDAPPGARGGWWGWGGGGGGGGGGLAAPSAVVLLASCTNSGCLARNSVYPFSRFLSSSRALSCWSVTNATVAAACSLAGSRPCPAASWSACR